MILTLAQSPDGPIQLITGEPPVAGAQSFPLAEIAVAIGVALCVALIVWAYVSYRKQVADEPAEHAFRSLLRQLGIRQAHGSLIRRLAAAASCKPVALLVSDHALRAAAMCFERSGASKRDRELIEQLLASQASKT